MKKELIQSIREKEIQLAKLREHVDKSSVCSDLYKKRVRKFSKKYIYAKSNQPCSPQENVDLRLF